MFLTLCSQKIKGIINIFLGHLEGTFDPEIEGGLKFGLDFKIKSNGSDAFNKIQPLLYLYRKPVCPEAIKICIVFSINLIQSMFID